MDKRTWVGQVLKASKTVVYQALSLRPPLQIYLRFFTLTYLEISRKVETLYATFLQGLQLTHL